MLEKHIFHIFDTVAALHFPICQEFSV